MPVKHGSGSAEPHGNPLVVGLQQVLGLSEANPRQLRFQKTLEGAEVETYFKMRMGWF